MKKSFTKKDIKASIAKMVECFPQVETSPLNQLRKTTEKIAENYEKLAYPNHPNWSYCIPLVPNHTLKDGTVVDIGICINSRWLKEYPNSIFGISANFVTSNEGPDYYSGDIRPTSEMSKIALIMMKHMEIIDDMYILKTIGNHNGFLDKFMYSDLTLWDMQDWIDNHIKKGE
jgi:hypothetical protein